jgi:hypothetical protein
MKHPLSGLVPGILLLAVTACEPREAHDPVTDPRPQEELGIEETDRGPVATTRAASQPPAVPIGEVEDTLLLADTLPEER